jgi:hypothetical protein
MQTKRQMKLFWLKKLVESKKGLGELPLDID